MQMVGYGDFFYMFQRPKVAFIHGFIMPMVMKDGTNGTRQSYQVYKYLILVVLLLSLNSSPS